eukprot:gene17533-biopygen1717
MARILVALGLRCHKDLKYREEAAKIKLLLQKFAALESEPPLYPMIFHNRPRGGGSCAAAPAESAPVEALLTRWICAHAVHMITLGSEPGASCETPQRGVSEDEPWTSGTRRPIAPHPHNDRFHQGPPSYPSVFAGGHAQAPSMTKMGVKWT